MQYYLFLLGRLLFGGYFMMAGLNHFMHLKMMAGYAASKKVPMPKAAVIVSGLLIFLGGLWVLTGVYVPVGVAELALFLVVVTFKMHDFWNDKDPMAKMGNMVNFQKNTALLGAALMLLQIGDWGWVLSDLWK